MTPKQFYDTVVEMRKWQRAYFRSKGRDKRALQYAKDYECKVDEEIARVGLMLKEEQNPRLNLI